MKSRVAHALALLTHLLMCAILACAALFSHGVLANPVVGLTQQQVLLSNSGDVADATFAAIAAMAETEDSEKVTGAPESPNADLADDLPELMPIATWRVTSKSGLQQRIQRPMQTLPHQFPEPPQRPPRLTIFQS